jgi:hypothetical protein
MSGSLPQTNHARDRETRGNGWSHSARGVGSSGKPVQTEQLIDSEVPLKKVFGERRQTYADCNRGNQGESRPAGLDRDEGCTNR